MFQTFFRSMKEKITLGKDRPGDRFVYFAQLVTALWLFWGFFVILPQLFVQPILLGWYRLLRLCVWSFVPVYRLDTAPLTLQDTLMLVLAPVFVLAFPVAAFYIARDAIAQKVEWTRHPGRQAEYTMQHHMAEMRLLRMRAERENELRGYWRTRKKKDLLQGSFNQSASPTIA
ncbi:MAG TPA: hypothetical protein VKR06_13360 [Ktedonosporobacter sp.]|nr:hypothetical protein [Ktedonosporobacter sp.]